MKTKVYLSALLISFAATSSAQVTEAFEWDGTPTVPDSSIGGLPPGNWGIYEIAIWTNATASYGGDGTYRLNVLFTPASTFSPTATGYVSQQFYNYCLASVQAANGFTSSANAASYGVTAGKSVTGNNPCGLVDAEDPENNSPFTLTIYASGLYFTGASGSWFASEGFYTCHLSVSGSASGSPNRAGAVAQALDSALNNNLSVQADNGV